MECGMVLFSIDGDGSVPTCSISMAGTSLELPVFSSTTAGVFVAEDSFDVVEVEINDVDIKTSSVVEAWA